MRGVGEKPRLDFRDLVAPRTGRRLTSSQFDAQSGTRGHSYLLTGYLEHAQSVSSG